jgi:hypothetical protein
MANPVCIIKCGYTTGATKLYATGTIFKRNSSNENESGKEIVII